eukprot:2116777-Rhodomonas_salina.2
MAVQANRDPFEPIPKQIASTPWTAVPIAHAADPGRVEETVANAFGVEVSGSACLPILMGGVRG